MKNKDYFYSLRIQIVPGDCEDERLKEMVSFCKESGIDDVMFFICAEDFGNGHVTKEMAKPYVEIIKKAKIQLEKIGVTTSLNPWATLYHNGRGRKLHEGQNFGLQVDYTGAKSVVCACPLSNEWVNYYTDYIDYLCSEIKPYSLWIEDDFRVSNHGQVVMGCFCDEHLKKYAEQLNLKSLTREKMVSEMIAGNVEYRQAFKMVNGNALISVLERLTEKLKKYGTKTCIMCGGYAGPNAAGNTVQKMCDALSKYKESAVRAHVSFYRQSSPYIQAFRFNRCIMPLRAFLNDDVVIYSEIENFPMTRYSKSAKFTSFIMRTTAPLVMQGATFDIFEFNGNGVTDSELFSQELKSVRNYLANVNSRVHYQNLIGIERYIDENESLVTKSDEKLERILEIDNFLGGVLSTLGGTVKYTNKLPDGSAPLILSSKNVKMLEESVICDLLKNRTVILDAEAVEELIRRNLGERIGVKSITRLCSENGDYTYEQSTGAIKLNKQKMRASAQYFVGDYGKIEYVGEKSVLTEMYNYKSQLVGAGITRLKNVIVFPFYFTPKKYEVDGFPAGLLSPLRREIIAKTLIDELKHKDVIFTHNDMVLPYLYKENDGDYLILNNYIEDDAVIKFTTNNEYDSIYEITDDGDLNELKFSRNGSEYELDYKLKGSSCVMLKLIKN